MDKIRIKLTTPQMIADFVNICSKYDYDINVHDGKTILDAKSIVAIFSIETGKTIEVEIISSYESVISSFIKDMRKFEVEMCK